MSLYHAELNKPRLDTQLDLEARVGIARFRPVLLMKIRGFAGISS